MWEGDLPVNTTRTDRYNRSSHPEEQLLYNHLIQQVQLEPPAKVMERFRTLFIDGAGYPDAEILTAVDTITRSPDAQEEFKYILNRCCHILINRWQTYPNRQVTIPEFVALFDEVTRQRAFSSRYTRRLSELVQQFTHTEQYSTLKRLAEVINPATTETPEDRTQPLRTLIPRYPYLYEHCLVSEDSSYEQQKTIQDLQNQRQRQFEIDLSQYVTHQVREARLRKAGSSRPLVESSLKNPTLLSNRDLAMALKHYVGKVEGGKTYRDLAQSFLSHTSGTQSYKGFKDDLYEYLIPTHIDSAYGRRQFNDRLYKQLQNTMAHSDSKQFSDFLMMRTCSQLLNYLVVESPQKPQHFVFVDMMSNLGPIPTTGLLLKIVLICSQIKPYLEKRFAILFNHYESSSQDGVRWLVKGLENLNLALSTNYGKIDLSFIR